MAPASFPKASCEPYNSDVTLTMGCWCELPQGGWWVLYGGADAGCPVKGREQQCLYTTAEFQPCTSDGGRNEDPVCRTQCDTLLSRIQADSARQLDVSVNAFACFSSLGGGSCDCAYQTGDLCWVNGLNTTYPCSDDPHQAIRRLSGRGCGCASAPGALIAAGLLALMRARRRR
jgi:hypothetical protein